VSVELFRVILPVADIESAAQFYSTLLGGPPGERVTPGRHYFDCHGTLLACWDAVADGDPAFPGPNPGTVYLATVEPLSSVRTRVLTAGAIPDEQRGEIARQPWGERSFYARDPWGNRFCIVEQGTEYRGGGFTFR
jgi:catechol 2,3-dioxygenase-like lactoylglutathione lyase family enzyme